MKVILLKVFLLVLYMSYSVSVSANGLANTPIIEEFSKLLYQAKTEKDTNVVKAIVTIQKAIQLAESVQNDSLLILSKNSYSLYLLMSTRYEESRKAILSILPSYHLTEQAFMLGVLYNRLGYIELKTQNFIKASEYLYLALSIIPKKYFRQRGITHTYLTNLYVQQQDYDAALEHIEIALKKLSKSKKKQYETMALTELGMLHYKTEDYKQARSVFHKALNHKIDNNQFKILPLLYLGLIDYHHKDFDSSKAYLIQVDSICRQTGNIQELPQTIQYLSQISYKEDDIEKAFSLAEKSLSISKSQNFVREEFKSYLLLSQLYIRKGQYQKSINFDQKVFNYASENSDYELLYKAADQLANSYATIGDFEKSYEYRTDHQKAQDMYMNAQNIIEITGKTTKYRLEQERKQEQTYREEQIGKQKLFRNIGIILLLLFALFSFVSHQLNIKRKKANNSLKIKNQQLIQAELNLESVNKELQFKNQKLEEYIDVNLQLENFAHIASHDLKAPLREQASFIQLLEKDTLLKINEKERSYLSIISKSNSDMQTLIEDMIEYSLIKSDDYKFTQIDPSLIIKKAEYLNRDLIYKEKATIILNEIPTIVKADSSKLIVVFRNLIHNSLTYKRAGIKPVIEIGGERRNDSIVFYVRDNGTGIHPNYRKDIFDVFKRLPNKSEIPGNGLGLTIVKQVVEKHSGHVWLESESEKGSTFYFSIAS